MSEGFVKFGGIVLLLVLVGYSVSTCGTPGNPGPNMSYFRLDWGMILFFVGIFIPIIIYYIVRRKTR